MLWVDPFIEPEDPAAERLLLHLGMSRVGHRVLYQDSERLAFLLTIYGGRPKQSLMIPMVGIDDGGPHRTQI